jgi:hypothetical protein
MNLSNIEGFVFVHNPILEGFVYVNIQYGKDLFMNLSSMGGICLCTYPIWEGFVYVPIQYGRDLFISNIRGNCFCLYFGGYLQTQYSLILLTCQL